MQYIGVKSRILHEIRSESLWGDHSYIELFARNTTPCRDVWENEVNKHE